MACNEFEDRPSIMLTRLACIAALALFAAPLDASAQSYPSRPITVIVPFPAGGPSDVVARIVTDEMGKNSRAIHGRGECWRRGRHDRQRTGGRRESGRLHLARGQHGLACRRSRAHVE